MLVINITWQMDFFLLQYCTRRRRLLQFNSRKHFIAALINPYIDSLVFQVIGFYLLPHFVCQAHPGINPVLIYGNTGESVKFNVKIFTNDDVQLNKFFITWYIRKTETKYTL